MPTQTPPAVGWQIRGRCGPQTAHLFYAPDYREHPTARAAREHAAKVICRRCPVLLTCRQFAMATRQEYGIWGG